MLASVWLKSRSVKVRLCTICLPLNGTLNNWLYWNGVLVLGKSCEIQVPGTYIVFLELPLMMFYISFSATQHRWGGSYGSGGFGYVMIFNLNVSVFSWPIFIMLSRLTISHLADICLKKHGFSDCCHPCASARSLDCFIQFLNVL